MDIRMPEVDGIEATRQIARRRRRRTAVLVLTTFDLDEYVYEALRAGASGFLLKDAPEEQLVTAIRVVADGGVAVRSGGHAPADRALRRHDAPAGAAGGRRADAARAEVLTLVARGLSNAEIAEQLVVSEHTVKTHVAHILGKLGLRDRVQAVVLAYEAGLVRPGEA